MQDYVKNFLYNFKKETSPQKKTLLIYLICLLISFIYVPQYVFIDGNYYSRPYTFIWSHRAPVAHIDLTRIFITISILTIIFGIIVILLPRKVK